jgi:cupin 2 domain-containing protein
LNLFSLPASMAEEEVFEAIIPDRGVFIERILSTGQVTPPGVCLV